MYPHKHILIIGVAFFASSIFAKMPEVPYVVETVVVKPVEQFLVERRYIGTIRAEKFSMLSPRSAGTVASIEVKAGQKVKKGQLLISLKSTIEKRAVELAEQHLELLREELSRNTILFKSEDITKSALEKSKRDVLNAESQLASLVQKQEIRSPFDGIVGVPRVVLGETVQPGNIVITVMDFPYSVIIRVPASRLAEIKEGQRITLKTATSKIDAVERSIDPVTRTGFAIATFTSCESCIIGDSVYVSVAVHEKPNALLISRNAIYYKNQKPHIVLVVKGADNQEHAEIREIVVGEEQDGLTEVISGLKSGDQVVVANPKRIPPSAVLSVVR